MDGWIDEYESYEERSDIGRKPGFSQGEDKEVELKLDLTWECRERYHPTRAPGSVTRLET